MNHSHGQQSGFTLLETLVAVFIFAMALVSLMAISSQGIRATDQATSRATAQFLAQEGIELVEQARADNFLDVSSDEWMDNITIDNNGACGQNSLCMQDSAGAIAGDAFVACGGTCPVLRQDSATGLFGYSGDPSPYTRSISIDDSREDDGYIRVSSVVSWQRGRTTFSVEAVKYLTDWFQ